MRRAFTLIELVVALGILAVVLSFAGMIFRVSIDSHRIALANAEIMQKLRVIAEQLNADFQGLRDDGELFIIWDAARKSDYRGANANDPAAFERLDRIMFFTTGDFQTYKTDPPIRGNVARVCYTLVSQPADNQAGRLKPRQQKPSDRMLARTVHVLVPTADATDRLDTGSFTEAQWREWSSDFEYDNISLQEWMQIPRAEKIDILSVIGDVTIAGDVESTTDEAARGVVIDLTQPDPVHALLCEGVGQFAVQGWSDAEQRWIPQVNPNGDESLDDDSDFLLQGDDLDPENKPGIWYPRGALTLRNITYPASQIDNAHRHEVPGLGRALKFTFTLYDSKGIFSGGRTFTHIVYLDD
ncbi:MAG: prepilin-type N-terminal cleavage/methylation domain-containing protein [Sedimentisphaerales bacterium]|jgi:prepilin-type N-terminal cleavage/methylation domain-containing protein|nr:prepilin-type N-terminal cleavage/methylation domain-containing protein [Sedimentisphaerales bacterium]NLT77567.1 type II secretion system protein [Planctomycetota bacterium]